MKIKVLFFLLMCILQTGFTQPVFKTNIGHTARVGKVKLTPDGRFLISCSDDLTAKLWETRSGREVRTFTGHTKDVKSLDISPDGKTLATASMDNTVKIWNIADGTILKTFENAPQMVLGVNAVVFSPDGKSVSAGGWNGRLRQWNVASGQLIFECNLELAINALAYSPDGKLIASATSGGKIMICNNIDGKLVRQIQAHSENPYTIAFGPDGKIIASAGRDNQIKLHSTTDGAEIFSYKGYVVNSLAFSPNGKILVCGAWGTKDQIRVWDIATKKEIKYWTGHTQDVTSVTFSSNGKLLATGSNDGLVKLWNIDTGQEVRVFNRQASRVEGVTFGSDNLEIVAGGRDSLVRLWNLSEAKLVRTYKHNNHVLAIAHAPDGNYIASGGLFNGVRVWNKHSGQIKHFLTDQNGSVDNLAFSPDGKKLVSGSWDNTFKLYDTYTGSIIRTIDANNGGIKGCAFSPDGKMIAGGAFRQYIKIWDAETGNEIRTLNGHSSIVQTVVFSSDGKKLVSGSLDKTVKIWDIASGTEIRTLTGHTNYVTTVAISPNGKFILSGSYDNTIKLWNAETGELLHTLTAHNAYIEEVAFSPNGKLFLSCGYDGSVKIWRTDKAELLATLYGFISSADWIIITPDGYWDGSANVGNFVAMVNGLEVWNIDQFAIKNNRPDIILERLGCENKELIKFFHSQYTKRLRKLKLTENQVADMWHVPESKITKSEQIGKYADLQLSFEDKKFPLKHYNIYINDVPIFAQAKDLKGNKEVKSEQVELVRGLNKIEISCINTMGTESYRDAVTYNYTSTTTPNLYFLGFGVSEYSNSDLNLNYADKDALDLEKIIQNMKGKGFENIYSKILTNEQVTPDAIKAAKDFVKNAKPDDTFILFIAGHGMHDKDAEATYYYLTSNADVNNLKGTAADFETIEDLLQGIPPRNKLFLMDACESGEIDEEDQGQMIATATGVGIASRGFKSTSSPSTVNNQPTTKRSYLYQKDRYIYNDLVRRSGAIVFSSSKGGELSYERSDIENGLFTEYIMKALTTAEADKDNNGIVSTDELRQYVSEQVAKASGDLQHPTVDRDNIYQKFGFDLP